MKFKHLELASQLTFLNGQCFLYCFDFLNVSVSLGHSFPCVSVVVFFCCSGLVISWQMLSVKLCGLKLKKSVFASCVLHLNKKELSLSASQFMVATGVKKFKLAKNYLCTALTSAASLLLGLIFYYRPTRGQCYEPHFPERTGLFDKFQCSQTMLAMNAFLQKNLREMFYLRMFPEMPQILTNRNDEKNCDIMWDCITIRFCKAGLC